MSSANTFFDRAEKLIKRLEALFAFPEQEEIGEGVAWRWRTIAQHKRLEKITTFANLQLTDLLHIEKQKMELERNTKQFLSGLPANNALLWGPRGTGKSSLIKALFNEYSSQGLKLVEVEKSELTDLPEIVDRLRPFKHQFVIYCDDLSFDSGDAGYRGLKSVLDGSVLETPDNIIIYATSNRRHLVPEYQKDNQQSQILDGELHHSEAVEERVSLSERFGLWLSFQPMSQKKYLDITEYWLKKLDRAPKDLAEARAAALKWALLRGSRSGRVAHQFSKDWAGRSLLEKKDGSL